MSLIELFIIAVGAFYGRLRCFNLQGAFHAEDELENAVIVGLYFEAFRRVCRLLVTYWIPV